MLLKGKSSTLLSFGIIMGAQEAGYQSHQAGLFQTLVGSPTALITPPARGSHWVSLCFVQTSGSLGHVLYWVCLAAGRWALLFRSHLSLRAFGTTTPRLASVLVGEVPALDGRAGGHGSALI